MYRERHFVELIAVAIGLSTVLAFAGGCTDRNQLGAVVLGRPKSGLKVVLVVDTSGSFKKPMLAEGKAFRFATSVIEKHFRHRIGTDDRLVISQVSGTTRNMIWEGRPLDLRRDFKTPEAFRDAVMERAAPHSSLINLGLANTLNYVMSDPRVASGETRVAVFVLSDLIETGPDKEESERTLDEALAKFGQAGHVFGAYYVDQLLLDEWRKRIQQSGIREYRIEPDFVGDPELPEIW